MTRNKSEIVSFKADPSLLTAMKSIPNRSEFIRQAILSALKTSCPLCGGTGILSPHQKEHWDDFAADHNFQQCRECQEYHLVCTNKPSSIKKK
jgi:hypothetical protein